MAQLYTGLGELSGKFGDFVFRRVNGKVFVVKKAVKKNQKRTVTEIASGEKFALAEKLTSAFRSIPGLNCSLERTAGKKLRKGEVFSFFHRQLDGTDCSKVNFFPENDFQFTVSEISKGDSGFELSISLLPEGKILFEPQIRMHGLLVLYFDEEKTKDKFKCVPLSSLVSLTNKEFNYDFHLPLSPIVSLNLNESLRSVLICAIVVYDNFGNAVKNSGTIYFEVKQES